jgi:transposase
MPAQDSPQLKAAAVALRQQGYSLRQIGRRLGVHSSVVARLARAVPFDGFSAEARAEQMSSRRDNAVYQRALDLRRAGWSYAMITAELGVGKSTLSGWLKGEPRAGDPALQRSQSARIRSGITNRLAHQRAVHTQIAAAADEIPQRFGDGIRDRDLFVAGLMLYWAEGDKTQTVSLTNSDPTIIACYIRWLRQCLAITETRFRCEIHLYPDVDIETAEQYWSDITRVPRAQFYTSQVDTRDNKSVTKRGKLPYGTLHVKVVGKGTTALHRQILGWIAGFASLVVQ